jgi:hypothetical protein
MPVPNIEIVQTFLVKLGAYSASSGTLRGALNDIRSRVFVDVASSQTALSDAEETLGKIDAAIAALPP